LHPDIGVNSAIPVRENKLISGDEDVTFLGEEKNGLFCIPKEN
jgi:hypothetical protein